MILPVNTRDLLKAKILSTFLNSFHFNLLRLRKKFFVDIWVFTGFHFVIFLVFEKFSSYMHEGIASCVFVFPYCIFCNAIKCIGCPCCIVYT